MKAITLSLATLALLGTVTLGMAETTVDPVATQTQTQEMKQDRVREMNQLKEQMASMSPQERQEAMNKMQAKMESHQQAGKSMGENTSQMAKTMDKTGSHQDNGQTMGEQTSERAHTMNQTRTMTQEHSRTQEMTQNQQMQQMQQMQQRHGADMEAHGAMEGMQTQTAQQPNIEGMNQQGR